MNSQQNPPLEAKPPAQDEFQSLVQKVEIANLDFYVVLCWDREEFLSHIYIHGSRQDQDSRQFLAGVCNLINLCLEEKVPCQKIYDQLKYILGETQGLTNDPGIRFTSGILDFLGRTLEERFPEGKKRRKGNEKEKGYNNT